MTSKRRAKRIPEVADPVLRDKLSQLMARIDDLAGLTEEAAVVAFEGDGSGWLAAIVDDLTAVCAELDADEELVPLSRYHAMLARESLPEDYREQAEGHLRRLNLDARDRSTE